jgi:hypothetical protein
MAFGRVGLWPLKESPNVIPVDHMVMTRFLNAWEYHLLKSIFKDDLNLFP